MLLAFSGVLSKADNDAAALVVLLVFTPLWLGSWMRWIDWLSR
jgi:hypothetical protein